MKNIKGRVEFGVKSMFALYTIPVTKQSGHPVSYFVPTYESLIGLCKCIYWHKEPHEITYTNFKVRVMNDFRNRYQITKSFCDLNDKHLLVSNSYLYNVHYQISADIVYKDGNYYGDDQIIKSEEIFMRNVKRGLPYSPVHLGKAECTAYIINEKFGEGKSFYDGLGKIGIVSDDPMFIKFDHKDGFMLGEKNAYFGTVEMNDGIVEYPSIEKCFVCNRYK